MNLSFPSDLWRVITENVILCAKVIQLKGNIIESIDKNKFYNVLNQLC